MLEELLTFIPEEEESDLCIWTCGISGVLPN